MKKRSENEGGGWIEAGFIIRERKDRNCYEVDLGTANGKRRRKHFETLDAAGQYCQQKRNEITNNGTAALGLSDLDRHEAAEARAKLGKVSILEAVDFWLKHHRPEGGTKTIDELVPVYLAALEKAGRRPHTIEGARKRAKMFAKDFGTTPAHEITTADIEKWLDDNDWQQLNRRHYIAAVHALMEYAIKQHLLTVNPAAAIDKPAVMPKAPEILTPEQVRALLVAAVEKASVLVPHLAISFLAGLRPNELRGLDWKDVDLSERIIRITPEVAKMRRQRLVDISDNLAAWLLPHKKDAGPIWPHTTTTLRRKMEIVLTESKVSLPYNAGRHAFASYHLAEHSDPGKTSLQLGHSKPDLLFTTYRGLVTKKAATAYWTIMPVVEANVQRMTA